MTRNRFRQPRKAKAGAGSKSVEALRLASELTASGRLDQAEEIYRQMVALAPGDPVANYNLGVVLLKADRHADAVKVNRRAWTARPAMAVAHNHLGLSLSSLGRKAEALDAFRNAVTANPLLAVAHANIGRILLEAENFVEAESSFRSAIRLGPTAVAPRTNLSDLLRNCGRLADAEGEARAATALAPNSHIAWNVLANAMRMLGRAAEAAAMFRRALTIEPESAMAHNNLGNALRDLGDAKGAIEAYRAALRLAPESANSHSSLIFTLDFDQDSTTEEQQAERDQWWRNHGERFARNILPHPNVADPDRKLRIGYVSAHFNQSSSASTFGPVILGHDSALFDVICYSGTVTEDRITGKFKNVVARWRSTLGVDDDRLARQIREDGIDILIDTVGHMAGHRLGTFARKPAPVQVTAWGQANGTGLRTIDYLLSDQVMISEDERPLFAEKIVDLPSLMTYAPSFGAPDVVSPPAIARRHITFGSFNREGKVTPETLALWGTVLAAVPNSRLLLKYTGWAAEDHRARALAALGAAGIDPERIEFRGRTGHVAHLAAYADVDIALDPIPISGGITSLEALWMGVPVINIRGRTAAGRSAASFMATLGLGDWIAESPDDYRRLAVAKSADLQGLADLRRRLRPMLLASPIGDTLAYTRAVETAYRAMWRRWCASQIAPRAAE